MTDLERRQQEVEQELAAFIDGDRRVAIVKAPPGSGKTTLLLNVLGRAAARKMRIAVGTQTNSQADDVCARLLREQKIAPIRFASASYDASAGPAGVPVILQAAQLPPGSGLVVAPIAKWGSADNLQPYDVFVVDEAWQMSWASFMPCQAVAGRFVLIGDPGQIDPVVSVDSHVRLVVVDPPGYRRPVSDAEAMALHLEYYARCSDLSGFWRYGNMLRQRAREIRLARSWQRFEDQGIGLAAIYKVGEPRAVEIDGVEYVYFDARQGPRRSAEVEGWTVTVALARETLDLLASQRLGLLRVHEFKAVHAAPGDTRGNVGVDAGTDGVALLLVPNRS